MQIKNIILDMGNVLLDFNPDFSLDNLCKSEEAKVIIRKELFGGEEWVKGDLGIIKNEERFELVKKRIPEKYHAELEKCVNEWDICMKPLEGAKDFCIYLKENGYRLFLLSNACNKFYDYFPKQFDMTLFDGIVVSSDIHIIKPDAKIYNYLLEKFSLKAKECLFIDDRADNVEGAKTVGMHGFQFKNDYEAVKKLLE